LQVGVHRHHGLPGFRSGEAGRQCALESEIARQLDQLEPVIPLCLRANQFSAPVKATVVDEYRPPLELTPGGKHSPEPRQ